MKALILSAGQGSRLLPLTENRPKCLLPIGEQTLIEWQIQELVKCNLREFIVVVGFQAPLLEAKLAEIARHGLSIRTIYNPFFQVADNLGSCWLARAEMEEDFLIVNGDTLFEAAIPQRLVKEASAPITVTIDRKDSYDADDMKVQETAGRLVQIGKTLPLDIVNGESIGMLFFRGGGPQLFAKAVDQALRAPEGLKWWYLKVIDQLAKTGSVGTVSIEGLSWGEVDFPADLQKAQELVQPWAASQALTRAAR